MCVLSSAFVKLAQKMPAAAVLKRKKNVLTGGVKQALALVDKVIAGSVAPNAPFTVPGDSIAISALLSACQ
jgi:hypothetical protein